MPTLFEQLDHSEKPYEISEERIAQAWDWYRNLSHKERRAYQCLFYGAKLNWTCFDGRQPHMNKAECEWVDDWRGFYLDRLPAAGLFEVTESEPIPYPTTEPKGTLTEIKLKPTELGFAIRELSYKVEWDSEPWGPSPKNWGL